MTSAFDDIDRPDTGSRPQDEGDFAYLNRSGRVEAERVRALIDEWTTHYPSVDRPSLLARLRSTIDGQHRSAFFELLLHELLVQRGHKVIAIEPDLPGTSRQPDFLVETGEGERYYLEAVVARGLTDAEVAAERRLNSLLRAIDDTPSPNHFLDLRVTGTPRSNVTINKLRRTLGQWIAALPVGDAAKSAAPFSYEQDGMSIRLTAWPKHSPEKRTRSIGVRHFGASTVTRARDIGEAVEFKARRYGRVLELPLLVAVSGFETFRHDEDAVDVLLGTEVIQSHRGPDGNMIITNVRAPDGIWFGPEGPRRRVLSGVLWLKQIDAWNFATRDPLIVVNPWAERPMPTMALGIREVHLRDNGSEETPGGKLGEVLALPPNWPED